MEFDKRIKEGKRPLTCFDLNEAEEYVGKKCYISNEYDFFRNLDFTQQKILNDIEDCETPFHYDSDGFDKQAEFCLPCDWVKDPEKKYRPYSLNEFLEQYKVGDLVEFRRDGYEEVEHAMFTGYVTAPDESGDKNPGENQIVIGAMRYSFAYLFEYYELFYMGCWQPFGVLDEEKE